MIRTGVCAAAAIVMLTGAADTRADRDLADALKGRTAGAPADCVRLDRLQSSQVIGDRTIVYRDGRRTWVNQLAAACPGLDWNTVIVSEVYGNELCKGDLFKTLDRGSHIPGPSCRYGAFVPYTKTPAGS